MSKQATNLYNKMSKSNHNDQSFQKRIKKSLSFCFDDFQKYINLLTNKHVKRNYFNNPEFVIDCVYSDKLLKTDDEIRSYCKVQLSLASYCFNKLRDIIINDQKSFNYYSIIKYKNIITDYIFDLKPIVEYLEQKEDPKYIFFSGGKNYETKSYETYRISRNLFWTCAFNNNFIDQRSGYNLSSFSLRQSLELKFKRIVGAIVYDKTYQPPKIKHDFFYNFITQNLDLYEFTTEFFSCINKIYKWTNLSIHTGTLPNVWELQYALDITFKLFQSKTYNTRGSWSVFGAVKILNYDQVKHNFFKYFENNCQKDNTIWCIEFTENPEAIIMKREKKKNGVGEKNGK
ncbi:hypothetical protein MHK_004860 [Candidatus Magnetomorum sp. HK-1]|nr:hypothetical protein MHK_004860 [Candidatus Magnetomorum sp. HK-1]